MPVSLIVWPLYCWFPAYQHYIPSLWQCLARYWMMHQDIWLFLFSRTLPHLFLGTALKATFLLLLLPFLLAFPFLIYNLIWFFILSYNTWLLNECIILEKTLAELYIDAAITISKSPSGKFSTCSQCSFTYSLTWDGSPILSFRYFYFICAFTNSMNLYCAII